MYRELFVLTVIIIIINLILLYPGSK